jgi:hypothetical protein
VSDALTYAIEIAVGLACLLAAPQAFRRRLWAGAVAAVAGLAAVAHGLVALLT